MDNNLKRVGAGRLGPLIKYIFKITGHYTHRVEAEKKKKGELAARTFAEYLHRLDLKYDAVKKIENILNVDKNKEIADLLERQLVLVDRTESYHQHVYSTLSALILFLSHVADKPFVHSMPSRSIKKFLNFAEALIDNDDYRSAINVLRLSNAFRNQFVVHPQQHVLYNWATVTHKSRPFILYFKPDYNKIMFHDENKFRRNMLEWDKRLKLNDTYDQNSVKPIDLPEIYAAPDVENTHTSILNVIPGIITICNKDCDLEKGNDKWDRYTPSTLKEIILLHKDSEKDSVNSVLSAAQFSSRIKAKYTGSLRPIPYDKKNIIAMYCKNLFPSHNYADMFVNEYLFYEETSEYWLPVQSKVADFFDVELSPKDSVYLYCVWVGAVKRKKEAEWIFLVNEFEVET